MATPAVDFVPVLTAQTVGFLADSFENSGVPEKALSLRKLQPFVQGMVERFFPPLSFLAGGNSFAIRFKRFAQDFEPYRFYLNGRLLNILGNHWIHELYPQFLNGVLESHLKVARDMAMSPELIFTAVHDYQQILQALTRSTAAPSSQAIEDNLERITDIVEFLHASTRFDYGLTAVFLVLENSIPAPPQWAKVACYTPLRKPCWSSGVRRQGSLSMRKPGLPFEISRPVMSILLQSRPNSALRGQPFLPQSRRYPCSVSRSSKLG